MEPVQKTSSKIVWALREYYSGKSGTFRNGLRLEQQNGTVEIVYTMIIAEASGAIRVPIIECEVVPDSLVYSDCWRGCDILDVSDFYPCHINHARRFAERENHINGIENFWNQAKRHRRKFKGVPKDQFGLYLTEGEWRFNNSGPSVQ